MDLLGYLYGFGAGGGGGGGGGGAGSSSGSGGISKERQQQIAADREIREAAEAAYLESEETDMAREMSVREEENRLREKAEADRRAKEEHERQLRAAEKEAAKLAVEEAAEGDANTCTIQIRLPLLPDGESLPTGQFIYRFLKKHRILNVAAVVKHRYAQLVGYRLEVVTFPNTVLTPERTLEEAGLFPRAAVIIRIDEDRNDDDEANKEKEK